MSLCKKKSFNKVIWLKKKKKKKVSKCTSGIKTFFAIAIHKKKKKKKKKKNLVKICLALKGLIINICHSEIYEAKFKSAVGWNFLQCWVNIL